MRRFVDDIIFTLSKCEILVFGSNLQGEHLSGTSRVAHQKFGAVWGAGEGPTGQCYAIPTENLELSEIKTYVDSFIEYAKHHPNNRFILTRVGCEDAAYNDLEMASLFKDAFRLPNVNFPKKWLVGIVQDDFIDAFLTGIVPGKEVVDVPEALTEKDLIRLCEEYKYVIGSGIKFTLPQIRIRYVIDQGRFGYVNFGDFFLCDDGELYVWSRGKDFEEVHNQDMVEEIFGDECKERGKFFHRVIFAGVETTIIDSHGRRLYTGDVIRIWLKRYDGSNPKIFAKSDSKLLALGTLGENEDGCEAYFACALDNHCILPEMCSKIEWSGTLFYMLDWSDYPITISRRCLDFQDIYSTSVLTHEDKEVLAKYTPNFDKDWWKYHANQTLGIEYNSK